MDVRDIQRIIQLALPHADLATVKKIHGNTITVQVKNSPRYLHGLPVVGGTENLNIGDLVTTEWIDGRRYARSAVSQLT